MRESISDQYESTVEIFCIDVSNNKQTHIEEGEGGRVSYGRPATLLGSVRVFSRSTSQPSNQILPVSTVPRCDDNLN